MTRTLRVSPTLVLDEARGTISCANCGHALADAGGETHWKDVAALRATPAAEQPGWSASVHGDLLLRQFFCPSCASLLDSEVGLPEDPFLYDVVHR
jgi:acetone carboxylase gamma subunit